MFCKVKFNYYEIYHHSEMYRKKRLKLAKFLDDNGILHPLHERGDSEGTPKEWQDKTMQWCDNGSLINIIDAAKEGIEFSVVETKDETTFVVQMAVQLKNIADIISKKKSPSTAEHIQIAIHGNNSDALLSINKVEIHENLCTDYLQRLLDSGFRILAICPQANQRRPDYVMGKCDIDVERKLMEERARKLSGRMHPEHDKPQPVAWCAEHVKAEFTEVDRNKTLNEFATQNTTDDFPF